MSASIASATPGYCTLTATARSPFSERMIARCTCPMEAAAIGSSSNSTNRSRIGAPSSRSISACTKSIDMGGACDCNWDNARRMGSGKPSSRKLAIWPSFIRAPFMLPSSSATCCAVFSSRSRDNCSFLSAPTKILRAEVPMWAKPMRAPSRASLLFLRQRERSLTACATNCFQPGGECRPHCEP